jgi:polyisoprenoid-binding protein YceI
LATTGENIGRVSEDPPETPPRRPRLLDGLRTVGRGSKRNATAARPKPERCEKPVGGRNGSRRHFYTSAEVGRALALAALLLLPSVAARAEPRLYAIDPARSQLRFYAVSRFMDADGGFRRFGGELRLEDGRLETAAGRVTVEVASIDTANGTRDNHLRSEDFFDARRHPEATLVVAGVRREGERVLVAGELTIRGVSRAVTVPVTAALIGGVIRVTGELVVNRREFGIAYQSRLNPIKDDVKVRFDLTLAPK